MTSAMSMDAMMAELNRLKAENDSLKKQVHRPITIKVSEKGAVSVYGINRFPVTLYAQQWQRLLSQAEDIKTFIEENDELLQKRSFAPHMPPQQNDSNN